jgi:hypothetical protein
MASSPGALGRARMTHPSHRPARGPSAARRARRAACPAGRSARGGGCGACVAALMHEGAAAVMTRITVPRLEQESARRAETPPRRPCFPAPSQRAPGLEAPADVAFKFKLSSGNPSLRQSWTRTRNSDGGGPGEAGPAGRQSKPLPGGTAAGPARDGAVRRRHPRAGRCRRARRGTGTPRRRCRLAGRAERRTTRIEGRVTRIEGRVTRIEGRVTWIEGRMTRIEGLGPGREGAQIWRGGGGCRRRVQAAGAGGGSVTTGWRIRDHWDTRRPETTGQGGRDPGVLPSRRRARDRPLVTGPAIPVVTGPPLPWWSRALMVTGPGPANRPVVTGP